MKIAEYAVKNPQLTLLLFLMVIVVGINTIINMPRSEDPELSAPEFPVIVVYPGTGPKDMEDLVVKPMEAKFSSLENIKRVTSTSSDGLAIISVIYKHGSNVDEKYQEVIREVNSLRNELPQEIASIEVIKWVPSNVNVIQTALVSENASFDRLKKTAEKLKDELEKLPMLKNVKIHGLPEKYIRVDLNFDKMNAMHIPADAVMGFVQSEAMNIPGGNVDAGTNSYNIKTSGNYENIEDIKKTIVASYNGKNVLLEDIASVYPDFESSRHITRLNGRRCLFVVAAQKPGENISATQKEYLPVLDKFKKTLPGNVDMITHFDQAENVNKRLGGLGVDFLIAIGLVAITLLPLGGRAAQIVMISIPLSLSIGIILVNMFGFNLNQLSIVGLVVALGLLVDDSIVVVENIERWLREGHSRTEAAIKATKQIGLAVIGCTATLTVAFLPLLFLPEASGDFIRSLPVGVISCVLASMVVSLTVIPFLSSKVLKEHAGHPEGNIFLRLLKKAIHGTYARLLEKALARPLITITVALVLFTVSLLLFPVIGFSLFPASEKPQFRIQITTPSQSSIELTNKITADIEGELAKIKDVKYYAANVGKGNPQVYYNVIQANESANYAEIFVQLDEHTSPSRKLELIQQLRAQWTPYPGAEVLVKNFEQGPPIVAPVEVRLFGDNLDTLRSLAAKAESLIKETEGTIYVQNPLSNLKSDIKLVINKEKAQALGIPTINIDKTVRLAVAGFEAGKMNDPDGKSYKIKVTRSREGRPSLEVLDNLYVNTTRGTAVPLSQLTTLRFESTPQSISHFNKLRKVSVSAYVKQGYLNDKVIRNVMAKIENMNLPYGYTFEMGGELQTRKESFAGFSSVIMATIFMFIGILILEFKTFKSTLIVLSVIPLGIIGAVFALLITGNSLSFVAIIGLIALAGIEVKNTILLVDFTNQLRLKGIALDEAVRQAGEVRFLPIILTSLTAIGGMLPIAVSTNPMISPLAIVIIGGLISSTLLSRVVTPVVYKLIPPQV